MPEQETTNNEALVRLVEPDERLRQIFGNEAIVEMSFDPKTPEGAELLFISCLDKLPRLSDMANETLFVRHIFQHPAEKVDPKTSEVNQFIRTVVIDKDNNAYDCGSEGVRKAIVLLKSCRGAPPWNPPIACKVLVTKTTGGNNWMILRPDAAEIFKNATTPRSQPAESTNVPDHGKGRSANGDGVSKPK